MRVHLMGLIIASVYGAPSAAFAEAPARATDARARVSAGLGENHATTVRERNEGQREETAVVDDAARYQALEAASPEVLAFEGSGRGIYIGTGAALVVAAVVLLLVLL